jgi:hypothetical protein
VPNPAVSIVTAVVSIFIFIAGFIAWVRVVTRTGWFSLPAVLFLWGALIMVFLAFWSPGQPGFRLHVLFPRTMGAIVSSSPSRWVDRTLALVAAILFGINFCFGIYPASFIQNNAGYQILNYISAHVSPGDVVVTGAEPTAPDIEVLRPYFFPEIKGGSIAGRLFAFHEKSLDPLQTRLIELLSQGHQVYLSDDLFVEAEQRKLAEKTGLASESVAAFVDHFETVGVLPLPNGRSLRRVEVKNR